MDYNTGTTKTVTDAGNGAGSTITIPAGVEIGDEVFIFVYNFTFAGSEPVLSVSSSGPSTPVAVGSQEGATGNAIWCQAGVWKLTAASGDPGATITFSATNGATGWWFDVAIVSYTGALTSAPVDGNNGAATYIPSGTGTVTTPSATTSVAGDWQVQFVAGAVPSTNDFATPAGLTLRQHIVNATNDGVVLLIADSNGSVGGSGTPIGNTTWTASGGSSGMAWIASFVIGLTPAATAPKSNEMLACFP
jgi:hypothetical protein